MNFKVFTPFLLFCFFFLCLKASKNFMKSYLAFNYSYENPFPIYLLFNKIINSCNVKLQQRHLADIYEKLAHSMPITMQCGGKPKNSPTLTANNSGLKPSTTTFSESNGRQLSHGIPRLGQTFEIVL